MQLGAQLSGTATMCGVEQYDVPGVNFMRILSIGFNIIVPELATLETVRGQSKAKWRFGVLCDHPR